MKKLLLFIPLLLLASCDNVVRKTPLDWCLWEIHKHENYDCEWSYIYSEIQNYEDNDNYHLNGYYVTVFTDDRIGEWYCFIECEHKSYFARATGITVYSWEEVNLIDCDLVKEEFYE